MAAFAKDDIDRFTAREVLAAFGLPSRERGPCPLCLTSEASQAFVCKGIFFNCFACGRKGNAVGLYAALGGISRGRAVGAIAQALGLTPADGVSSAAARDAALAARDAKTRAERIARARWQGKLAIRDILRREAASIPDTILGADILANLYRQLGDVEAWIEQATYPRKAWA